MRETDGQVTTALTEASPAGIDTTQPPTRLAPIPVIPTWVVVAVLVAAVVLPVGWLIGIQWAGPDDGTLLGPSISFATSSRWRSGVVVQRTHGNGGDLRVGDVVQAVDGVPLTDLVRDHAPARRVGDRVRYQLLRDGQQRSEQVTLQAFPAWSCLAANANVYVLPAVLFVVAAVVFMRRPYDRAAQLMLAVAAFLTAGTGAWPLGLRVIDLAGGRGVWPYVGSEISNMLMWAALVHFTLVFPEPAPIVRRHPWLTGLVYALPFGLYVLSLAITLPNASGPIARLEQLISVSSASARVIPLLLIVLLVLAYRRTRDTEMRQRLHWVVASLVISLLIYVVVGQLPDATLGHPLLDWGWIQLSFITCPLAIAAAILRYRLFDIELIIKRSLVYTGLTVCLVAIYLGTLVGLTQWFPSRSRFIAVAAGGLVALCFHPLRNWLRQQVSRLIYGARDDPYQVVSRLSQLDAARQPRAVLSQVTETLAQTLRLSYVAVEFHRAGSVYEAMASSGQLHGRPTMVPLTRGGDTVGRLLLDVRPGREPFGPADRRLLDDVARQVSRLADVVLLSSALQRSRERLVTTREEERRRLHRDLHDGIGPTLAAQAMQLDVARVLIHSDPAAAEQTIEHVAAATKRVIGEVRRLVDDLRPPALDQLGLVSAIREQTAPFAREAGPYDQFRVDIDAAEPMGALPAAVEVAAYRIATEAVTNAARHGHASHCRVRLRIDQDALLVEVHDDGIGLPADPVRGVGLRSMHERTAELGGSFSARSAGGGGALIIARLPLRAREEVGT
jgi:two-component system, NarL family, sensor kinase